MIHRAFSGGCHCGNIRYRLDLPVSDDSVPARACGCSFCRPRRATYTSHPAASLQAEIVDQDHLSRYQFATETAEFLLCARCGVLVFAISEINDHIYAVVNVFSFDDAEETTFEISTTDFDGETVEDRLKRRTRNWIPEVVIEL